MNDGGAWVLSYDDGHIKDGRLVEAAGNYGFFLHRKTVQETRLGPVDAEILSPIFSRDTHHLAYVTHRGEKLCVVVDCQSGPEYDEIGQTGPVFSPDGRRVAYMGKTGRKSQIVVDGRAGEPYDAIGGGSLTFSEDSNRVAYGARNGEH